MKEAVEAFVAAVVKQNELANPAVQRLLRLKLEKLNSQREQIKALQGELLAIRKDLQEYAKEYYLMGNECITKAHDPRAALRCFDKALKLNPSYVDALVRKGVTLLDLDEDEEAYRCLNQAVKLAPKEFKARYNRGKCLLKMGHEEEALGDFLTVLSDHKDHPNLHAYLAETYQQLGDELSAAQHEKLAKYYRRRKKG